MATIDYYGIIAIKFSGAAIHHHSISNVFMIPHSESGYSFPGKLYTKDEAIAKRKNFPIYTLEWDYEIGKWKKGALVDTEKVNNIEYLRTVRDNKIIDNLKNCIDYDFFDV